jgi:hypothetical protein
MPVHDGSGSNQDERLLHPDQNVFNANQNRLCRAVKSSARPLPVQSEQLPTESQVFEDEVLAGAKRADVRLQNQQDTEGFATLLHR